MSDVNRRDAMAAVAVLGTMTMSARGQTQSLPKPAATPAPPVAEAAAAWNLADLYPDAAAWETARAAAAAKLPGLAQYKDRLGESAATLKAAYQAQSAVLKDVLRLYVYATLKADEDLRNAADQERRQLATDLYSRFGEAVAFVGPELLTIGEAKVKGFLAADAGLAPFRFGIEDTLRQGRHVLSPEGEALLAAAAAPLAGARDIRNQLAASDMPRPTVTLSTGEKLRLDDQGYSNSRDAANRADRKLIFDNFFASYRPFESSLGAALTAQVKSTIFSAKARRYDSALEAALEEPNLPVGVYRTLIAETNAGLPVLHRYFELRRRMLKLPDIAYHDIYPPLVALDRRFTMHEMRALTLAAVTPLGSDYGTQLAKATSGRWMDPRPRQGKASGAYMFGSAYDVHPYLLLNLSDKYDGLTTYAHEWGHAMHTLLANAAQPFETASYPTFTAEIASTAQEGFLAQHMLTGAKTREEKLFYLGQMMESYRGTFFRQAMFAEFQLAIHELAEKGEGLSGARMTALYLDLLRRYHGPKLTIDPAYAIEWAFIPHFFRPFYVFQYATSITAANFFVDAVRKGGGAERDRYLAMLRAGGADHGYALLRKAGLDMASPTPYRTLVRNFTDAIDQAERLLS